MFPFSSFNSKPAKGVFSSSDVSAMTALKNEDVPVSGAIKPRSLVAGRCGELIGSRLQDNNLNAQWRKLNGGNQPEEASS